MMAIWYVDSAATGTNSGTSWANAWTSLASAFSGVTAAGDVIYISSTHNEQLSADTSYTIGSNHVIGNPLRVFSVNKINDTLTPGAFVGHSSLNRSITFTGTDVSLYIYGVTFSVSGTTVDNFSLSVSSSGMTEYTFDTCTIDLINTASTSVISVGANNSGRACLANFSNCTFRFGNSSQSFVLFGARTEFTSCSMSAGSAHPSVLFFPRLYGASVELHGCDLSNIPTIVKSASGSISTVSITISQSRLKPGWVAVDSATTSPAEVTLIDCSSGDIHGTIGYTNEKGTLIVDTGIYCNDNISGNVSWAITTSSLANRHTPFVSPWISVYHSGTSPITPYLEILRSGVSSAFTDVEVWAEWSYKGTSGSTRATTGNDGSLPLSSASNQSGSLKASGDWTGENVTSWFGVLGPGAPITPAEAGDLSFRVCVAVPNTTVYVDPQIRGLV